MCIYTVLCVYTHDTQYYDWESFLGGGVMANIFLSSVYFPPISRLCG